MLPKEKVSPRCGSHSEGAEGVTGSTKERSRAFFKKFMKAWGDGVSVPGAILMNPPPSLLGGREIESPQSGFLILKRLQVNTPGPFRN